MTTLLPPSAGYWFPSHRADPRGLALYLRHYSAYRYADGRPRRQFVAGMEHMVLLGGDCAALWVWTRAKPEYRADGQTGCNCVIFRNEGPILSSLLVAEADELAWRRWPGERHFTYVDPGKVRHKRDAGRCFLKAGWRYVRTENGERYRSKRGLLLLERLP